MTSLRLALAYVMDLAVGDPEWFPHPVRWFGRLIHFGERWLRRPGDSARRELVAGAVLTSAVVSIGWTIGRPRHRLWQVLLAWTALATRSLLDESQAVIRALETHDLALARERLSRIVGRDTVRLDETEIAKAVIETLAESACDGIVAPLFWMAVGGLPCAMAYKAVNTLDSMIGHPEPPYRYFGRVAARLDDAANLVPARLTALGIVAGASFTGLDAARAARIWWRDGSRHASPNAGQSEAAIAGALGVRLGDPRRYGGQVYDAPALHPEGRPASVREARAALSLVAIVSSLAFGAAVVVIARRRKR